jgi:hypothetical protein
VSHYAHPRRASNGQQLCEQCPIRLSQAQGKLHVYGSGHICDKCYQRIRRGQPIQPPGPSAAPIVRPSHKRKMRDSEAGELRHDATTENVLPRRLRHDIPPLPTPSSLAPPALSTHGWILAPPDGERSRLARSWVQTAEKIDSVAWNDVARGRLDTTHVFNRVSSRPAEHIRAHIRRPSEESIRSLFAAHGIDLSRHHLVSLRLLRSAKGDGEQAPHFDSDDYDRAQSSWSFLWYLTDTNHTAFPLLDLATMGSSFTKGNVLTERQLLINKQLCARENFISSPVPAGTIALFRNLVAHHGIKNPSASFRYVLYGLFSLTSQRNQDVISRFPLGVTPLRAE